MTRDQAISEIQWHLGNRSDLLDQIVLALARAQRQLELGRTLPWFLKEEDAPLILPAGSADVAFPTGFLREYEGDPFRYTGTQGQVYLEKVDIRTGVRRFGPSDKGRPLAYAIRETGWQFWPRRDISYTLTFTYYKSGGSLATDTPSNPWLINAPETLIGKAGGIVASVIAHDRAKALFDEMFLTAFAEVIAENEERERENLPVYVGGRL